MDRASPRAFHPALKFTGIFLARLELDDFEYLRHLFADDFGLRSPRFGKETRYFPRLSSSRKRAALKQNPTFRRMSASFRSLSR